MSFQLGMRTPLVGERAHGRKTAGRPWHLASKMKWQPGKIRGTNDPMVPWCDRGHSCHKGRVEDYTYVKSLKINIKNEKKKRLSHVHNSIHRRYVKDFEKLNIVRYVTESHEFVNPNRCTV